MSRVPKVTSSRYLRELEGEVDFLPVDKRQRLLQIDTIIFSVCSQAWPIYLKYQVISLQYLKKEVSIEIDFLHADKRESFLQIDTDF